MFCLNIFIASQITNEGFDLKCKRLGITKSLLKSGVSPDFLGQVVWAEWDVLPELIFADWSSAALSAQAAWGCWASNSAHPMPLIPQPWAQICLIPLFWLREGIAALQVEFTWRRLRWKLRAGGWKGVNNCCHKINAPLQPELVSDAFVLDTSF